MDDTESKADIMRALAFPVGLVALTAAVFFAVTQKANGPVAAKGDLPVENIESVSFSAPSVVDSTPITSPKIESAARATEALTSSLVWSTKNLPDLPALPGAALPVTAPAALPPLSDLTGEATGQSGSAPDAPPGALEDHSMMMEMPADDPTLSACVAELRTIANRTRIYFDSGSTKVSPRDQAAVYQMGALAQRCPEAQIVIDGFTDPKGDPNENLLLSWKRANNVLGVIREAGFNTMQFTTHSHMDNHPAHCTHYDVVDRRVEFVVTQNPKMAKSDRPLFEQTLAAVAQVARATQASSQGDTRLASLRPQPRPLR